MQTLMLRATIGGVRMPVVSAMDSVPGLLKLQAGSPQLTFLGNFLGSMGVVIAQEISR